MRRIKNLAMATAGMLAVLFVCAAHAQETTTMRLFDEVVFYDGYLVKDNPDKDLFAEDGILRNYTYLYAVKLTDEQLNAFGSEVTMNVWIRACCDNYDRIGNINLALIPKDSLTYDPLFNMERRIELGRFITPFMDKNKQPDTVPFTYRMDYVSYIFRDAALREQYNYWVEFELFGVPYAANTQIAGCEGRNDVFFGTLDFVTSASALGPTEENVLAPIVMKKPEYIGNNLNNYNEQATDQLGETVKTYTFEVPEDVADGQIVLITSSHGANAGGEEYNRRWHYIYVDDELELTYKPGRTSCEPFRKYNTQMNGIYHGVNHGSIFRPDYTMSDEEWQSFSNWCPGDVIDNRVIPLGPLKAGTHTVRVSVPEAEFVDQEGDIRVSMFFQGLKEGQLPDGISAVHAAQQPLVRILSHGSTFTAQSEEDILSIEVYDLQGKRLYSKVGDAPVDLSAQPSGIYLMHVELANGIIATHKVAR